MDGEHILFRIVSFRLFISFISMFNLLTTASLTVNKHLRSLDSYAKKTILEFNQTFSLNENFILVYFKAIIDRNLTSFDYYKRREISSLYDQGKIGQPELVKKLPKLLFYDLAHIFYYCTNYDNSSDFQLKNNIGSFELPKILSILITLVNGVKSTIVYPEGDVTMCPKNVSCVNNDESFEPVTEASTFLRICSRFCITLKSLGITDFVTIDDSQKLFTTNSFSFNLNSKLVSGELCLELPGDESDEDILIYSMLFTNLDIPNGYKKSCAEFIVHEEEYLMLICSIMGIELPIVQTIKNSSNDEGFSAKFSPVKEEKTNSKGVNENKQSDELKQNYFETDVEVEALKEKAKPKRKGTKKKE